MNAEPFGIVERHVVCGLLIGVHLVQHQYLFVCQGSRLTSVFTTSVFTTSVFTTTERDQYLFVCQGSRLSFLLFFIEFSFFFLGFRLFFLSICLYGRVEGFFFEKNVHIRSQGLRL